MTTLDRQRVLLAEDDPMQARLLQQALTKAGASVEVVGDGKTARERLTRGGIDVFVTDWMMPELDGIELARDLRGTPNRPVVILLTALNVPGAKAHALAAGADDYIAKPVVAHTVVETIRKLIARRASGGSSEEAPPAASGADHPVAQTAAWKTAGRTLREVTASLLNVPVNLASVGALPGGDSSIRRILPLVDPEHLMEMHVHVELSRESARELARVMLGDADTDEPTLLDLIGELANVSAGALKTAFAKDGFPFTMGIAARGAPPPLGDYQLSELVTLRGEHLNIGFALGVKPRNAVTIPASKLREGMVLADNLRNNGGALILPVGTRLTATATARLQTLLRDRSVRICVPEV